MEAYAGGGVPTRRFPRAPDAVWSLVVCAAVAVVWSPIAASYFFADDYVWMLRFSNEPALDVLLAVFGGHVLIVRNLVFWAEYRLFGLHYLPYACTVLATHLVNVWLLFRVVRAMTNDVRIATLAAAAWGLSPMCGGTLDWYSVYGQVLASTALLAVLAGMARSEAVPARGELACWSVALLLGSLCFGVGIGVAVAFPVMLFLLRPATLRRPGLAASAIALPLVVAGVYFAVRRIAAWRGRLSGIEASVIDQAFAGWRPIVEMWWRMIAIGAEGLVAGVWSTAWSARGGGSATLLGAIGAAATTVALVDRGARARRIAAAAVLCAAAYAIIALGRANLYAGAGVSPTDAARQLRYQYVGPIGTAMVLAVMIDGMRRWRGLRHLPTILLVAWAIGAGAGVFAGSWRIARRDAFRAEVERTRTIVEHAVDAARPGDEVRIDNVPAPPVMMGPGLRPVDFPGRAALFVLLYPSDVVRERRVRFVERSPGLFAGVQRTVPGSRLARLLVPGSGPRLSAP